MKKIDQTTYLLVHAINDLTSEWLKEANDYIKANDNNLDNIFTNAQHDNIDTATRDATAKYSKEDTAKINNYKKRFTPLNANAKTKYMVVNVPKNATREAKQLITNILKSNI